MAKAEALQSSKDLKPLDVDVLRWFLFRAPERFSGFWFHSHDAVASACGVSIDTVQRALARLKACKLVSWVQRRVGGARRLRSICNAYRFPASALALSVEALREVSRASRAAAVVGRAARAARSFVSPLCRSASSPVAAAVPDPPQSRPVASFSPFLMAVFADMAAGR